MVLDAPFAGENHPVQPGSLVKEMPVVISSAVQLQAIESLLRQNKEVNLQAALVQGYAERKVLQLKSVNPKSE